jgi:soluble lytic murein transglycosylase-like protein
MRIAFFCIFMMVLLVSSADSEAAMYTYVDQYGGLHFTNVPADPRYKEVPGYGTIRKSSVSHRYRALINSAAKRFELDPELIGAIIKVESGFNPYAVSDKGAMGLMQLMPGTAKDMEVESPFEAEDNIMGGSRYLRKLLDVFDGNLQLGLAAYNAGLNRILPSRNIPDIPETREYVKRVLQEYDRMKTFSIAGQ